MESALKFHKVILSEVEEVLFVLRIDFSEVAEKPV
jgi:hypothetical protein